MCCHTLHLGATAGPQRKRVAGASHHNVQIREFLDPTGRYKRRWHTRALYEAQTRYARSGIAGLALRRVMCVRYVLRPSRVQVPIGCLRTIRGKIE